MAERCKSAVACSTTACDTPLFEHTAGAAVRAYLAAVRETLKYNVRRELQSLGSACHGV